MLNQNNRKVEYFKSEENKNLVKLSTVYDNNCSEQNTVEVNDSILSELIKYANEDNNYARWQRSRVDYEEFDEVKIGEVYGIQEKSFEEGIMENILLEELFHECGEKAIKRAKLAVTKGLSAREIAEMEGVSHSAINKSLKKVRKALCKMTGRDINF